MAKGFRLSKGFLKELRRLSKEAKGKRIACSKSVDPSRGNWRSFSTPFDRNEALAMDLALDDFDDSDLDWVSNWRLAKAREVAHAQFHEIFDPNYGPWEEVQDDLDQSDLDPLDVDDLEVNPSGEGSHDSSRAIPNVCNLLDGESSHSGFKKAACESTVVNGQCEVSSYNCDIMSGGVGPFIHHDELGEIDKAVESSVYRKRPRRFGNNQRQRKVIMGRHFLLVSRTCLQESDQKFQFFHMPSLSAVEVKVKELNRDVCYRAQHGDIPSDTVPESFGPFPMDEDLPSRPECVTETPEPASQLSDLAEDVQLHDKEGVSSVEGLPELSHPSQMKEDSSHWSSCEFAPSTPERVTDEGSGIKDLRATRMAIIWKHRPVDKGQPTVRRQGHRKQTCNAKKIGNGDCGGTGIRGFTQRKRKRETVIEDCCADPHVYRIPQRHVICD